MKIDQFTKLREEFDIVDLAYEYEEGMPIWPSHAPFEHVLWEDYDKGSLNYQLKIHEHCGTHIDTPAHFIKEGPGHVFMDEIPLKHFMGRCVTLDFSNAPYNYEVKDVDIQAWEKEHFSIEEGDIVFFNFGLTEEWRTKQFKTVHKGYSGLGKSAAEYLLSKKVKIVGNDAIALDYDGTDRYWCHYILLDNDILIMENVANLDMLPPKSYFLCLPLNVKDSSGSPVRPIALISKDE